MLADMDIEQTLGGQDVKMKMAIKGNLSYKVLEVIDTVFEIQFRYESLGMKMDMPNGSIEFDSESTNVNDIFSKILNAMKKNAFIIRMTKSGKVIEIKNIENLLNVFDEFTELSAAQKEQMKNQLSQTYGEKAFKGNLEMSMAIFPNKPVAKGEKWMIKSKLGSGMSADMETTYELKEITNDYYLIAGNAKILTINNDTETNGMQMKYDLNGTMVSEIKIDKKSGWILAANIDQEINGSASIKENDQITGDMTLHMKMKNKMVISNK